MNNYPDGLTQSSFDAYWNEKLDYCALCKCDQCKCDELYDEWAMYHEQWENNKDV